GRRQSLSRRPARPRRRGRHKRPRARHRCTPAKRVGPYVCFPGDATANEPQSGQSNFWMRHVADTQEFFVEEPRMKKNPRGFAILQLVWAIAGLMVIAGAGWHLVDRLRPHDTQFPTPFQAVLLANGAVYFGHLQGYGTHQPVLTEVYYVV